MTVERGDEALVSTEEAASILGVKPATIYTYVSRGRLESIRRPGSVASWFRHSDVERLVRRPVRRDGIVSSRALTETAITEIDTDTYRYRGARPMDLATEYTFEQVAEFLWSGSLSEKPTWNRPSVDVTGTVAGVMLGDALPLDRLRVGVSALAAADHLRFGRESAALLVTARHLMSSMIDTLPLLGDESEDDSLAARLWPRLSAKPPTPEQIGAIEDSLIIVADHGIAPSTMAVRLAAAYRADLYGVVGAGISILAGEWYGGRALSAENMLDDIQLVGDAAMVVGDLYRQGAIPCLGQPRYPGPDPRTALIVDLVDAALPGHGAVRAMRDIVRITKERALPAPSVELSLATLASAFELTKGASEAIYCVGRTAGWIAHALEVYDRPAPPPPVFNYISDGDGSAPRTRG